MEGIQEMERKRLLETAQIKPEESQAITNLSYFNVKLSSSGPKRSKDEENYSYWRSQKIERKKAKKSATDELPYELSRYIPILKMVSQDQLLNGLSNNLFPWIKQPSNEELGLSSAPKMFKFISGGNGLMAPDPAYPNSLRTTRATWANSRPAKAATTGETTKKENLDLRRNGPRVILFCLGGITYSEIRSVYELTRDEQREVFLGSTHIYSPNQFVDLLREIHKEDAHTICGGLFGAAKEEPTVNLDFQSTKTEKRGLFGKKK
jgi:syntaxin-binding protein 1